MIAPTFYITKKNAWYVAFMLLSIFGGLCGWGWPKPYGVPFLVLMPIVGFFVYLIGKASDGENSLVSSNLVPARSAIMISLIWLAMSTLIFRLQIPEWKYFWAPFLILTFLMFAFIWSIFPAVRKTKIFLGFILGISGIYSYGAVLDLNAYFDQGPPVLCQTQVTNYRLVLKKGRNGPYFRNYVTFSPSGPFKKGQEFEVGDKFYKDHPSNSSLVLVTHRGFLRIPWFATAGDFAN
jgi:hypothetical protein